MKRYGLVGRTLTHSFSKNYFTKKFSEAGITDCSYDNFELQAIAELPGLLLDNPDIRGLNVTIPYKEEVLAYLTDRNDIVKAVGACNCLRITGPNLVGYNTDVIGFRKSFEPMLQLHHKKALILGTGGSSKAIQYVLTELGIEYELVSRKKLEGQCGYEDIGNEMLLDHQIIINTTPLGMFPNVDADPPIPYQYINSSHLFFDLIYNPAKTKFLEEGEKRGAQIRNGYEMLINQAEESWRIWNAEA